MKRKYKLLTLISLLFLAETAYTQNKLPNIVTFDFLDFEKSKAKMKTYQYSKHGQPFTLRITNINKNLWTILDSTKQESHNTDMPDIFKGIKLPSFLNLSVPPVAGQSASASPGGSGAPSLQNINDLFEKINTAKENLYKAAELNNDFKNIYSNCQDSTPVLINHAIAAVNKFLGSSVTDRNQQAIALRQYLTNNTNIATLALKTLKEKIPLYISAQQYKITTTTTGIIWEWNNIQPDKKAPDFTHKGKAAKTAELTNEEIKTHISTIQATLAKAQETVDEIQKFSTDNKVEELITNYYMINESNFTYYTDELKIKEDELSINITITASKPLACNLPSKSKISGAYPTKGGFKVDFSTGIFGMAGGKDFLGREPYYKQVDSTTSMIKDKDGGNRVLLGVGALMHLYWRGGDKKVQYALSPGLSTTTSFDGVNFHLGGSLIAGKKNRIVFTLGVVAREAKILDRDYDFDNTYNKSELPEAPPTIKVFPKWGGFLSVTYNWSKLKKQ